MGFQVYFLEITLFIVGLFYITRCSHLSFFTFYTRENRVNASVPRDLFFKCRDGVILGFGKTVVTVTTEVPENLTTRSQNGTILLFYIKL